MWRTILKARKKPELLITLVYLFLGSLWIIFSDKLVFMLFDDTTTLTRVQTYKGWFYVLASGLLIYAMLRVVLYDLRGAEKGLRQSEKMQQEFLNNHYQPLWLTDEQGKCLFFNERWQQFAGQPISDDKAFAWLDRVHPHDKAHCIDKFTHGYLEKSAFELEYRLLTRDETHHWVQVTGIPRKNGAEKFQGFVFFLTDIEEKKNLQERYKQSSRRYGYLFANNPNAMFVYDMQDLRILEANKAAMALYGYSEKEFLSLSIIDLRPASEIPLLMEHMSEPLPDFHRSSGWLHKRKNGQVFDVEVSGHSLPVQNNRSMRLVIVRDITDQIQAFRSAKEGKRRFEAIFNHSPQGAVICSTQLAIYDINPAACNMLDIDKESALQKTLYDVIESATDPVTWNFTEKLKKGQPVLGEITLLRSGYKPFRASFNGIQFNEKGEARIFFSFTDIDEKHRMQIALEESERINATLVTNLPGMVYRCKFDEAWTMIFVSFGVEKLTGYKTKEILYNSRVSYNEIIHPDDRHAVRELVEKQLEKMKPFDYQYRIVTREGEIKWVREQARGIHNLEGELIYIEGFIMDVTPEKQALQKVEFQSHFLELIIDNIPFPMFYKNVNGIYDGCNKHFCEYLGLKKEQIIGHSVFEIFETEQARLFYEKDKECMEKGDTQVYETQIQYPDGRTMDAFFYKSVFHSIDNEPMGIIGVYLDITQRVEAERVIKKQLEELARVNSELEKFSYTVSHDLRSPLVTIKGFLGLLKEDLEDMNHEQINEDMMRIENATDKMQHLLEDLLKLSRLDKVVEQNEEFSMTELAHEAHELLFGMLKDKKCEVHIQPDMPKVVACKSRIRELYQNLMENAVKFSLHQQNPVIKVFVRNKEGDDVFCVQDNGMGIEPRYHEKIFGLFDKLDTNTPGTGLGLSLVKRIVENHNGRVWVESQGKNSGTTFCFTLNPEGASDKNN
ncbi:MAG: PAS domain S-box protein [bacterium]